jgi:hypothetical protein
MTEVVERRVLQEIADLYAALEHRPAYADVANAVRKGFREGMR